MISPESMHTINPLLDKLEERGMTIDIASGSPLHSVTAIPIEKATVALSKVTEGNETPIDPNAIVNALAGATGDEGALYESHQVSLDAVVREVAQVVRANMYLTRNIVLPIIDEYSQKLQSLYTDAQYARAINLNITTSTQDNILSEDLLNDFCKKHKGTTNFDVRLPRYHKQLSYQEIRALMKTGSDKFDKVIDKWIELENKHEMIENVFNDVYLVSATKPTGITRYCNADKYEQSIIALLIAWGLSRNVQDGIDAPLRDYEGHMGELIYTLTSIISQAISRYKTNLKQKRVVVSYPAPGIHTSTVRTATENIIVHQNVYDEYLNAGGTPEGILGAYLTDRKMFMHDLLGNQQQYVQVYKRTISEVKLINNSQLMDMVRKFLVDNSMAIIDSISQHHSVDAVGAYGEIRVCVKEYRPVVNEFIRRIGITDLNNIYNLMKRYICQVYFCNTAVEELIDRINLLDPEGKGDINDVAVTASIDFIVDWFTTQVTVRQSS